MKWDIKGFFMCSNFLLLDSFSLSILLLSCLFCCRLVSQQVSRHFSLSSFRHVFSLIIRFSFYFDLPFQSFEILNVRSNLLRFDRRLPLCMPNNKKQKRNAIFRVEIICQQSVNVASNCIARKKASRKKKKVYPF